MQILKPILKPCDNILKIISCQSLFVIILLGIFISCQNNKKTDDPKNAVTQQEVEVDHELHLPKGFKSTMVVSHIEGQARQIAVNKNGDIYIKLRRPDKEGGNAVLRDTNGDGRADLIKKFGKYPFHGNYGTGMKIHKGYLYYSSQSTVYRQQLSPDKMVPDSEMETIVIDDYPEPRREHVAKPLAFDDAGNLYVPFGAPSNACQNPKRTPMAPGQDPCPQLEIFAGVWKFKADQKNQLRKEGIKFATGIRSLVGMAWNPTDKKLYSVMHGRDDLLRLFPNKFSPWQSALLPSEEFIRIEEGTDFGWPYCYYDQLKEQKVLAPEYGGDGNIIGRCAEMDKPIMGFPGHWAPNGILFYRGDQFPERYKNGAFIAFHGSTNRAPYPQSGYFVAFIPFKDNQPFGKWEVFADGFAIVDTIINVKDAVYRPMGLAEGPDGSLYISETEKGAIWKIEFTSDKNKFEDSALADMENRKQLPHLKTPNEIKDNLQVASATPGAQLYNTYCATCHQANGKGDGARFPPIANTDWVTGDKTRLIKIMLNGMEGAIEVNGTAFNNVMPQHAFLDDQQIADVLTHIRTNFGNESSAISKEEVAALR